MGYPKYAGLAWFGRGRMSDSQYLARWQRAPLTYVRGQRLDGNWNFDHYEVMLGKDDNGLLFKRAAELALKDWFHPVDMMTTSSHFGLEERLVQPGDRVLQRIRLFEIAGRPVLEALAMNEVTEVIHEARRAGFTYTSTAVHSEIGEWSAVVDWRDTGEVVLVINVTSRFRFGSPEVLREYARRLQLHGHELSIYHFTKLLKTGPQRNLQGNLSTEIMPTVMLASGFLFLVAVVISIFRRPR